MATKIDPPSGVAAHGKHYYSMWRSTFEIDNKYVPIKPIGKGAYGIVCSAKDIEINEKVAIKKITNAFENQTDARRTLREIKLLRQLKHDNIIAMKDIMTPVGQSSFNDVYLVYDLMDTDLHQIIRSSQALTDDHCQYFIYQVLLRLEQRLEQMLVFDPRKRITVTEALEHPYLSMLHDPNLEPCAISPFDLDMDDEELKEEELREMVWQEMLYYHPEAANIS